MRVLILITLFLVTAICQAEEAAFSPGDVFKDCQTCPELVVLPAGSFVMGARSYDPKVNKKFELAPRPINIDRQLAVSRFEITRRQFRECVDSGGCTSMPRRKTHLLPEHPVSWVSWSAVQEYVTWLSKHTGQTYALLTEAEWEYAARGGSDTIYWWGDELIADKEVCNICLQEGVEFKSLDRPRSVGSAKPNPFGLYDMLGNVLEWVQDCYYVADEFYSMSGAAFERAECSFRMLKGSSYGASGARSLRISARHKNPLSFTQPTYGFRVKRTLPQ